MSMRELRPRAQKKDYKKMADGDTSEKESGDRRSNQNKNNNNVRETISSDDGGNIFGEELFNHDESDLSVADGEETESEIEDITDVEIADVEDRIKQMKLEEKRLKKLEKFRRLSNEAKELEKSIKGLRKKSETGRAKKKITMSACEV